MDSHFSFSYVFLLVLNVKILMFEDYLFIINLICNCLTNCNFFYQMLIFIIVLRFLCSDVNGYETPIVWSAFLIGTTLGWQAHNRTCLLNIKHFQQ